MVQLLYSLTVSHIEGQLRPIPEQQGEKSFYHKGDSIQSGQRLKTGGTAIAHLTLDKKHLILLPSSEYRVYYSDTLLQVTLTRGSIYVIDHTGATTVNGGEVTVTARGTTAIERTGETLTIIAVNGGATVFNERLNYGELLRKGYKLFLAETRAERSFYKDEEIIPLCTMLPCELKDALFCERCPQFSTDPGVPQESDLPLISGELYLHPFTLEADNNFPIPADEFPKGISRTALFGNIPHTLFERKQYRLYAQRKKEGRTDYYVLDGIITPDINNANRAICRLTLYSGEKDEIILKESIPLFLLDDFSTGGKVIDPLFFEESAKLIAKSLPQ